ncbi:alpha-L-rhamnosidase-related protein [Chitinophaga pinensis]|uniref:Ricin B lectin n=1 Tax=Chitinophaga pinensis (strain ATCC 43595 / DSM 2588 / LMG 13176 / NBRC 15968 / NCIMB 11800 / UQM 2034) TaxID=485918 RepID=A0A979G981_CHIPD|nr:RICIN domain-containing protein [Chitinophaga pinensis]ACU63086.1 Ricin B lectin [Chitinophaga pinensis DSM 2588]
MKYATMIISLLICMLSTNAQVTLYSDINYGGAAVSFPVGNYRLADMNAAGFPDDAVSSFSIPAGYQITFFADDNFTGKSFSVTTSSTWIGAEWNDQVTSFIVSIIPPGQGTANWIWTPNAGPANTWVAFRKKITLSSRPATALTKIAAENKYWLYMNNQLVVKDGGLSLRPDLVNTYYDEVDIAPYLQAGENTIAILVWYKGGQNGYSERAVGNGGLLFDAGSVVVSDDTWKCTVHPSFAATTQLILNGQDYKWIAFPVSYNAANEPAGWNSVGFNDASWSAAVKKGVPPIGPWNSLVPRGIPFWKEAGLSNYQNTIPTSITANTTITGTVGTNIQLRPYLRVNAPAGVKVKIIVNRHYWQEYITKAGEQEFECLAWQNSSNHTVTYEFTNVTGTIQILDLKYRETSYNADIIGQFNSSDVALNTLWTKSKNTSRVCMRDQYYDCPDRERGQWWGDVSEQILYSCYLYDTSVNKLTRKAFRELMSTQKANGSLYTTAPGTSFHLPDQNLAAVAMIWKYYMYSGDRALLQEIYPQLKKYIQFCVNCSNADGMLLLQSDAWNWIDWGTNIGALPVGSANTVFNALYISVLETAINTAGLLGQTTDVTYYQSLQTKVKNNFNNYFWKDALRAYVSGNVSSAVVDDRSNAWALLTGLANDQQKAGALSVLRSRNDAGPYQEMYIEEALFRYDPTAAITRMKNRFTPMINSWSSTLWEDFTEANSNAGYSSNNHAWSAGPLYVMSAYMLGIRPTQPAYAEFIFAPQPGGVTQYSGLIPSVKGNISASFSLGSNSFTQSLIAPSGTTAIVSVPKDIFSTLVAEIQVGGVTVWKNGTFSGGVNGVTFFRQDDKSVQFKVTPGSWQFTARPFTSTDPVITYMDCNYSGNAVSLPVGNYTLAQMQARGITDDAVSSLVVAEGYKVILYADDNFTGQTETLTANNNCITWSALHDRTTSIRVLTNGVTNLSGTYFIRNRASGLQMDVNGASTADGASVIHSEYNGNANQQFVFTHLGDGNYKILAKHSGKSLDVNTASLLNGTNVIQYPYHDPVEPQQNFIIVATDDGYYKIIARHSGKVLQVNGVSGGGQVHQWSNTGQVNGQWTFTAGTASASTENTSALALDPNPVANMITVKVTSKKEEKLYMRIYNATGMLVSPAQKIYSGQQFNLSALPAGVYIVSVTIGNKVVSKTIVKQ